MRLLLRACFVVVLACVVAACGKDPYVVVTVDDPESVATGGTQLNVTLDGNVVASRSLVGTTFPATLALESSNEGQRDLTIEVTDSAEAVIARAHLSVTLRNGSGGNAVATLARACASDPDCADDTYCDGTHRCVVDICVNGIPPAIDDGEPCTRDTCDEQSGIENVPDPLLAGKACTLSDASTGVCVEGTCAQSFCGDGYVVPEVGEQCDDGADIEGDGCSATCQLEAGFVCDGSPSVCTSDCGDGLVVGDEACDDKGVANNDGCSDQCKIEPGWACAGQPSVCQTGCGDHIPAGVEECDDGANGDPCDGCDDTCKSHDSYSCGDGVVCDGEACDDGKKNTKRPCEGCCRIKTCVVQYCGDGITDPGEICDDGNAVDYDGCTACQPSETAVFTADASYTCEVTAARIDAQGTPSIGVSCSNCSGTCAYLDTTSTAVGELQRSERGYAASAFGNDGSALVAFTPSLVSGEPLLARRFGEDLNETTAQTTIVAGSADVTISPSGALITDSATQIIAWGTPGRRYRLFDSSLNALSDEFRVSGLRFVTAASGSSFHYVVESDGFVFYRADASGIASSGPVSIAHDVISAAGLGVDDSGRVVAVSCDLSGGTASSHAIYVERFGSGGNTLQAAKRVSDGNFENEPIVGVRSDGSFVVAWSGHVSGGHTPFVRTYGADAQPISSSTRIAVQTWSDPLHMHAARLLNSGEVVVVFAPGDASPVVYSATVTP